MHLLSVTYQKDKVEEPDHYPFNVPSLQSLNTLRFKTPVTILVGENGTGKSTVLEAMAVAIGSITIGDESVETDRTLEPARQLARRLKLTWKAKTRKGFFLRSEDFFNYAKRMSDLRLEMKRYLDEVEDEYRDRSLFAKRLAMMPYQGSLAEMESYYGENLDAQSHGESFFELFKKRFVPGGLYILDEPEYPLSPMKQLALIALIKDTVEEGSQFIIATHSPVLMAYPGSTIISFDENPIKETTFAELEHVNFMRSFLTNPEAYLRHL